MPMATIHKMGAGSDLYHIHFLTAGEGRPDNTLPGGGEHPWRPGHGGRPGIPDHDLPDYPPPTVRPGEVLVLIRDASGHWHYAATVPGTPPPRPIPEPTPPGAPDQGLPGSTPTPTPLGASQRY